MENYFSESFMSILDFNFSTIHSRLQFQYKYSVGSLEYLKYSQRHDLFVNRSRITLEMLNTSRFHEITLYGLSSKGLKTTEWETSGVL